MRRRRGGPRRPRRGPHLPLWGGEADAAPFGVNAPHARLKDFLGRTSGVPIRRLSLCLAWFCQLERPHRRRGGAREVARDPCLSGSYRTTRRTLFAVPRYDMATGRKGAPQRGPRLQSGPKAYALKPTHRQVIPKILRLTERTRTQTALRHRASFPYPFVAITASV